MYYPRPFFLITSAPTTTETVDISMFHILATSISRSLYFDSSCTSLIDTFLSGGNNVSITEVEKLSTCKYPLLVSVSLLL